MILSSLWKKLNFLVWFGIQNLPLNLILNTSKHGVKNHWISSKSFLVQNGVQIKQLYYPSALRAGGVLSSRSGRAGGRAGGCQTCGTHISVTAWWIFSVRSSMELSRPVVVHCHAHLPICPIWACPWAENLSNLPQIGSRLCGSHISETAGWIDPI